MKKKIMAFVVALIMVAGIIGIIPNVTAQAATYTVYGVSNSYISSDIAAANSWGTAANGVRVFAAEHGTYNTTLTGYNANFLVYKDKVLVAVFTECSTLPDRPKGTTAVNTSSITTILDGEYTLTYRSSNRSSSTPGPFYSLYNATSGYYWNGSSFVVSACNGIEFHTSGTKTSTSSWSYGCLNIKLGSNSTYENMTSFANIVGTGTAAIKVARLGAGTTPAIPDVYYKVRRSGAWLPEVKNSTDYAGVVGSSITDIAMKVSSGSIKYRVHIKDGNWLPYATGYNTADSNNGYAGNGTVIDAVEAIYTPPSGTSYKIYYKVSPLNAAYYPYQINNQTGGGMDGYSGSFGKAIDRLQMWIQ